MKIRTRTICALVGALAFAAQAFAADPYPRLGGYPISGPHDYETATYQKNLAKLDVSVLTIYPGWEKSHNTTMGTVASNIKKINPNSRVFVYVIGESFYNPMPIAWTVLQDKVNAEKWWLYTGGTSGLVLSDFGHDAYVLNISTQSRRDANGQTFGQWFANYTVNTFVKSNPPLDGIYTDNVFWKPRRNGDWNLDGTIDDQNSATTQKWYREGYRQYAAAQRQAMPGKLLLANVADWVQGNAVLTEYNQVFNGGVIEAIIGKSYSIEARQGWTAMMAGYRKAMAALAAPKLAIFEQWGSLTDYQGMRYGLASCLMDDGYYTYGDLTLNRNYGVNWFDEYDSNLGAALKGPSTTAWQNGVYRRDFENGIALVNPKGNGSREVTLEADFVKLKGAQAPTVNNGQTVRKVTLQDRDGIILLRQNPIKRPAAPGGVTVESGG